MKALKIIVKSNETETSVQKQYPSASLMLDISREEYAIERKRTERLDNKANISMSAIIAVITLFVTIFPFSEIYSFYNDSGKIKVVIGTLLLSVLTMAMVLLIKSFCCLLSSFQLRNFACLNVVFLSDDSLKQPKNDLEKNLINHYNDIIKENTELNDEKAKKLMSGLRFGAVSFALLYASAIGMMIIMGV